ncbi:MAG: glycosyltransferase [Polynucleobacter sp.]
MSNNLTILHCAETVKGGIATYLDDLITLQVNNINDSNIVLLIPDNQVQFFSDLVRNTVITFPSKRHRFLNSISLLITTFKVLNSNKFNIIHLHSTFSGLFLRPFIFFLNISIVYCPHGWAWDRYKNNFLKYFIIKIEYLLSFITDVIICISDYEFRAALDNGFSTTKLVVAKNGINNRIINIPPLHPFSQWPKGLIRLLYVGRLDRQKGFDVLLTATNLLGANFFLKIAGDAVIDSTPIDCSYASNIQRLGWVSQIDLAALYSSADILIVPSRWEGFGLVALEAMKYGLPVVASKVGGLPEIIDDGVTGILVDPNSPESLRLAILRILSFDLKIMGDAGRERVAEHFDIARLHHDILNVYKALLSQSAINPTG